MICDVSLYVYRMEHEPMVVDWGCFRYNDITLWFVDNSVMLFLVASEEHIKHVQYLLLYINYYFGC